MSKDPLNLPMILKELETQNAYLLRRISNNSNDLQSGEPFIAYGCSVNLGNLILQNLDSKQFGDSPNDVKLFYGCHRLYTSEKVPMTYDYCLN